jgi:hypothetical protein
MSTTWSAYGLDAERGFLSVRPAAMPAALEKLLPHLTAGLGGDVREFRRAVEHACATAMTDEEVTRAVAGLTEEEAGDAYYWTTLVATKYVHGAGAAEAKSSLPSALGLLWIRASERAGCLPSLTYDALILRGGHVVGDGGIAVGAAMTSMPEEVGFVRVHARVEQAGGRIPGLLLLLPETTESTALKRVLTGVLEGCQRMRVALKSMYVEVSSPTVFFQELRPHLFGPDRAPGGGLTIEGHPELGRLQHKGGSGAQSPLLQALDIGLGVEHPETPQHAAEFFAEQRGYMRRRHRDFLARLQSHAVAGCTLATLTARHGDDECRELLGRIVECVTHFREAHKAMAHRYVSEQVGTGGTTFGPLLQQLIVDTKATAGAARALRGATWRSAGRVAMSGVVAVVVVGVMWRWRPGGSA